MNSHVIAFWRQSSIWARISLLLFVVFILLGIENYAMSPRAWVYTTGDGFNTFLSSQGDIIWKHRPHPQDDYVNAVGRGSYFFILHTGFSKTPVHHGTLWTISVPYGLLWIITAIAPVVALRRYIRVCHRELSILANRCVKCGYDLRSTPDRCPECGTIPEKPT